MTKSRASPCVCIRTPNCTFSDTSTLSIALKPNTSKPSALGTTVGNHSMRGCVYLEKKHDFDVNSGWAYFNLLFLLSTSAGKKTTTLQVKNNKNYTSIADLLTDDSFLAWQLKKEDRYDADWNEWMAATPENAQLAEQAAQVLNVFTDLKDRKLSDHQVNASFERLFKKIIKKESKLYSIL